MKILYCPNFVSAKGDGVYIHHRAIGLRGSRCSSVYDETVTCPFDLWEAMMSYIGSNRLYLNRHRPLFYVCLSLLIYFVSVYETASNVGNFESM